MKKFLISAFFCSFFSLPVFAAGFPFRSDIHLVPYAGVDASMRYSPFQRNFGGNLFKQYYPGGNVFFGIKFSDYLGAELGYKTSVSKTQVTSLDSNEIAIGAPVLAAPALHRTVANFKSWHVGIIGFIPVYGRDCITLLCSVGISQTKLFARDKIVQDTPLLVGRVVPYRENQGVSTFSKTKNILNLGAGLQIAIDEKTYCRLKANWENTSNFKSILAQERANTVLKPKNSITYSIGIVFNFF